ncbi:amino acid adenylation domain-containing protein [Mycobacterium sp. CVI_P3]|uniref:Amino acid adenylation domain-containing protein n=1 Tax=Mycobacterium pinniadriaticum TaxID=2994102 RepID=A0ABT3SIM3_9MYCO|nr:non-ribosomal peptide synthetase [Mycobacterium pinniadriaticum]MCX2932577.1 amino acid adenylation domain-containing protein [Mycobacterium pinniadriaticum]MCX2938979.1 amino acid adenylation domain-containing protein [Mycobacterium pinniadriaticum]
MTETLAADRQRLELLRHKLAQRGLLSEPTTQADHPVMSDGQRRMWFVQSIDTTGALLNVCVSYRLTGQLDAARLSAAVDAVAARHPVLRTTYRTGPDGEPGMTVHDDLKPGWEQHDLSELSPQARGLRLEVLAQRTFTTPFDLGTEAPLRITLAQVGPGEHVLLLAAHHIAWDDASWRVFFADLTGAYQGDTLEPLTAAPPPPSGTDEADVEYWRALLVDPPEPLELPGPSGSGVPSEWRADRCTTRLDADTVDAVTKLAHESGATPYMVLLAAFSALLHRYTHTDDFLVAAPVLNRSTDDSIGYYGNTVALRMRPDRWGTFRDLVGTARDTAVGAFAHQRVNLDRLVRELNPDRRYGVERMARVGFGMRESEGEGFSPTGVHCRRAEYRGQFAQLPLGFMVEFTGGEVEVEVEYLTEVIGPRLARQLLDSFTVLVRDALADPDCALAYLCLLDEADTAWLERVSRGEEFHCPAMTLGDLIAERAARQPGAIAVVSEGHRYSYREINEAANQRARWLIAHGIGAEDRVAVLLDKSPELVVTALGIAKAGAVYLPVDPEYPADRIAHILADADPKLTVRKPITGTEDLPSSNLVPSDLVRPFGPDNTAYLIYTSGSTGLPKGVPVPHRPVADYFRWFAQEYQISTDDRLLQVASPSFDVSIGEIFGVLAQGARLVIPRSDGLRDIGYLTDLLQREAVTSMHFVPSLLGLFLSLPGVEQWRTLRRVPIGGEALPGELADKFHATFDALLHNFYGPTETVINATRYKVEGRQGAGIVPIGTPKINTTIRLLDDALQPVPVDVIGEIYIGGTHLAHGYHSRPVLTAERFVADPFSPGGRLYRTGDLARRNHDGDLEFVGRADEQVKIRGFRIELGEVAAAITVDPSVGNAVVIAAERPEIGKSLIAYVAPAAGESADIDRIKTRVAAALPDYMIPAAYVVVDEIPVTANGKLDRAALPEPEIGPVVEYRAPVTETERAVAALFAELLGSGKVGCDDSFFSLGGHSLLATKLVAAVREACGVEVSVRDVFERGTPGEIAALIDDLRSGQPTSSRPRLVARSTDAEHSPLSAAQLRGWFQYRVDGPSPVNNIPFAARLTGPCDVDVLGAAVGDAVARHEILRTRYREIDGVPHQVVETADTVEVRRLSGPDDAWLTTQLDIERAHRFELESELPIRIAVLSTPGGCALSMVVHHIAADHWSAGVLFTDVLTAYRERRKGSVPSRPPLPIQYRDYAAWQVELLSDTELMDAQRRYWARQLDGLPEDTGLRPDLPRPPIAGGAGAAVPLRFDADVRERLTALSRELGITEFMLLQTAVAVVLSKAGGGYDIPLGTPVAGRTDTELDRLVGFFVNILVLRNDLSGNPTLREALLRARQMALAAYANQDLPFDRVVDAVNPVRSLSRNPLFGVVVHVRDELPENQLIESGPDGETRFTALEPTFDVAHADLSVNIFVGDDGYRGHVIYRTELYHPSTMQRFAGWLNRVIEAFATDPDTALRDVNLLGDAEHRQVLAQSRGLPSPTDRPRTVPEMLEGSRAWGTGRIALRCGDESLDYPALHHRSDRFAHLLACHGVGPGALVGMSMRRGIDLVVALVGIMKAGAGFFPLDPAYPPVRKQFMLDDVAPQVVVVTAEAGAAMPATEGVTLISMDDPAIRAELDAPDAVAPLAYPRPDDPMYLMFTSGSTGKPKGVVGTHRAMSTRLAWQLKHYPVPGDDIRLAQAPISFLEGCIETLAGLVAGSTLIVADDAEHRDAEALAGLIERYSVAQVTGVASLVSALVDSAPDAIRALRRLVTCGEPVNVALLQRLVGCVGDSTSTQLLNAIGATETSGALIRGPLDLPIPKIGKPMEGSEVYLLDDALQPVPVGVVGELYYAGEQIARGYWKQPGLTATRFIPNPYAAEPGSRFYRSGDRGRWTEDGRLEFVGRTDHQVKVRGFRVELAEVEAALRSADGVAAAAARTWDGPGGASLAGYVVPHEPVSDPAAFVAAVRACVAAALPGYMTPSTISVLDVMPSTESGKLNRPGLPRPEVHTTGTSEPARTDTERAVAAMMGRLLDVAGIGRDDDFFALGGDSIRSVQLAARMRAVGLQVDPRMIFEYSTVEALAGAIDDKPDAGRAEVRTDTRRAAMTVSGLSAADLDALKSSWSKAHPS